ncbi:polysaccharide biosynthesis C-terminal domain-containing protein [Leisingera aquaemixtae]|uniref:oligosaccharide flippase family protein n=1 Tax=Leisingera aquaemixtae TaxID=1396826 RepID=UPI001C93D4ED|nr:polysaccharide biosynthesis C-terminal domain-containing protein [Leisingera aquaemixtae]MBY6069068.1 polysaccharide biosynthesis C-terminal domain-containing protein [Leisingera aquaemixtae]
MIALLLVFLQTLVMTRVLGVEVFGLLSFAISISALLNRVLSMGLDQVLMRELARDGPDQAGSGPVWQACWRLVGRVTAPLVLAIAAIGLLLSLATPLFGPYRMTLAAAFATLPLLICRKYAESLILGAKQAVRSILGSQIAYPALMILGALLTWGLGMPATGGTVSAVYSAAILGSLLCAVIMLQPTRERLRASKAAATAPRIAARTVAMSGAHFAFIGIGIVLTQHVDVLMIGLIMGPEEAALVRIATRVAEMAGLMQTIVLLQYKPLVAEAHGKGDLDLLQKHVTAMTLLFVVTGIPITLGLWIFAEETMSVFGPGFTEGAWAMRIYVLGVMSMLVCGPSTHILSLCREERRASRDVGVALGIQVALNLLLIPVFGIMGCAFANLLALLSLSFLGRYNAARHIGIETSVLSFRKLSTER